MRRFRITLEDWRGLSEDDKFEYLAYDHDYQDNIEKLIKPFWDKMRKEPPEPIPSAEAFYSLLVESL